MRGRMCERALDEVSYRVAAKINSSSTRKLMQDAHDYVHNSHLTVGLRVGLGGVGSSVGRLVGGAVVGGSVA